MSHTANTGTGHSNNHQIIFILFACDIFGKNLQHKKVKANLKVSEVLITYVTNRGKAKVMLLIGAGHSNNCQIIFKMIRYYIFCNYLQHKKISSKFGGTEVSATCGTNRGRPG